MLAEASLVRSGNAHQTKAGRNPIDTTQNGIPSTVVVINWRPEPYMPSDWLPLLFVDQKAGLRWGQAVSEILFVFCGKPFYFILLRNFASKAP